MYIVVYTYNEKVPHLYVGEGLSLSDLSWRLPTLPHLSSTIG
ncbi:hypothetical protein M2132_001231, partial [Dysgonomonas sp. PH5-45]|nr:hypothetical protein [Dysgonomonas sp. PH5-45]MDH6387795.1 hypothetical protein [Dysgonomonas sp. PH5-37]